MSELLTPPLRFTARVIPGRGRGKTLHVPTLNLDERAVPRFGEGIYACWVELGGKRYRGALHFGPRPVFEDSSTLEVHLIDTTLAKTPETVMIELTKRLRDVRHFESAQELMRAMEHDIAEARAILTE